MITAMSLPFLAKKPIDLPPIVSVELIQITDKTNIPFAPKAKKTIEKIESLTILKITEPSNENDNIKTTDKNKKFKKKKFYRKKFYKKK